MILKDVSAGTLESLLSFLYFGSVDVKQMDVQAFLSAGEMLEIKGLGEDAQRKISREIVSLEKYHII